MKVLLSFHIIGIVLWLGGLIVLSRFLSIFTEAGGGNEKSKSLSLKIFYGWVVGGFVIAVFSGLAQIYQGGISYYFSQGWFHTKITLVVLPIIVTGALGM